MTLQVPSSRRQPGHRGGRSPFTCEQLEARQLLSTLHWDGGGDGVTLTDRYNWECNQLPGIYDTAVINVASNPAIVHNAGTFKVKKLSLSEELSVNGGTLCVTYLTTITTDGFLKLNGGTFGGTGTVAVNGKWKWTGGKTWGGDVKVSTTGLFVIDSTGSLELRRDVVNYGSMVWAWGNIEGYDECGTVITNEVGGLLKTMGEGRLRSNCWPGALINKGTMVRDEAGFTRLIVPFTNTGTLSVVEGRLEAWRGGKNSGVRNVAEGGLLHYFGNFTHSAGSTLTGGGTTIWQGGTHTITDATSLATFMHLTNVTVTGPGQVSVDGPITWNHGTLGGTGGYVINPGGKISLMTVGEHTLAADITNNGTLIWNNGSLHMRDATITNNAEKFFFVLSESVGTYEGEALVVNHGEIRKQLPTTLGFGGITLDNQGFVNVRNGTLSLGSVAQVQSAGEGQGSVLTGGAWSVFVVGNLDMPGVSLTTLGPAASVTLITTHARFDALGTLARNEGTLELRAGGIFEVGAADFVNAGSLIIHRSTRVRLAGNFTQEATGVLLIGIATAQEFSGGRLVVQGQASLAGQAAFSFGLFTPVTGQRFFFLGSDSYTGTLEAAPGTPGTLVYLPVGVRLEIA